MTPEPCSNTRDEIQSDLNDLDHFLDALDDEPECERCHGDGMDPWVDYLMPCPLCQGEQPT